MFFLLQQICCTDLYFYHETAEFALSMQYFLAIKLAVHIIISNHFIWHLYI
jgi:hypothetical protein